MTNTLREKHISFLIGCRTRPDSWLYLGLSLALLGCLGFDSWAWISLAVRSIRDRDFRLPCLKKGRKEEEQEVIMIPADQTPSLGVQLLSPLTLFTMSEWVQNDEKEITMRMIRYSFDILASAASWPTYHI